MNWIVSCYRRIPDRVRIGVVGLVLAFAFVSAPSMMAAALRAIF